MSLEFNLHSEQFVKAPLSQVFDFFSDAKNLEILTPPWLNFHVIGKSTAEITEGTLIDYKLKIHGIPVKWQSCISSWEPNVRFVDYQVFGPYKKWHHTHQFKSVEGGTFITDDVIFQVPLGFLGKLVAGPWVSSDVAKIFAYRRLKIDEIFK